ncbi:hypothetical protein JL722_8520 [Aureococcus anophagefferens]|nr:hypothetical protein JL722_8520 [Aureococcus anophagefferens]
MASGSWSAPMVSAGAGAAADGPVVALTREQGKNDGLAAALEGVASVEIPAVAQTRTADMEAALDAALLFVDEAWDWVVITSPEAARTFGSARQRRAAACIGETSARACEDLGFSAVFFPDKPGIPGWAASVRDAVESLGAE